MHSSWGVAVRGPLSHGIKQPQKVAMGAQFMIQSMTGYAAGQGSGHGYRWSWELRSVNGRGLDLRLRLPDWIDGLEPALRKLFGKTAQRGNISLSLRIHREDSTAALSLNSDMLNAVIGAMAEVEARARKADLTLAPPSAADIVALRGVLDAGSEDTDTTALRAALETEFRDLLLAFAEMRAREGAALCDILTAQLDQIADLTDTVASLVTQRQSDMADTLRRNLARVLDNTTDMDAARIAQELAVIAVKSDVTEEIDRLSAHVSAARTLLETGGAVGRKLDFLMQEFNREANTLCSKSQMAELTQAGLALKVLIDQMREQVQNVE